MNLELLRYETVWFQKKKKKKDGAPGIDKSFHSLLHFTEMRGLVLCRVTWKLPSHCRAPRAVRDKLLFLMSC